MEMLRHIVLFKFNENFSEEKLQAVADKMSALPDQVPQILSYTHGKDAGLSPTKFDYAMVADFDSEEDYAAYRDHPAHKAVGAEIMAMVADVAQMQFYC